MLQEERSHEQKTKLAKQYHEQGYGCAQAVLATFARIMD